MKRTKKTVSFLMAIILCSSVFAIQASASSDYVYGRVAGYNTTGYVSCESTKGTASTSISGATSDGMRVTCQYLYVDLNIGQSYTVTNTNSGIAGSISVLTNATPQSSANIRAYSSTGSYLVNKNGSNWSSSITVQY